MTPKQYVKIKKSLTRQIKVLERQIDKALGEARDCPFPTNTRSAGPEDIKKGAVIWYRGEDYDPFWCIVEEVHHPSWAFNAYIAQDGCRYGLDQTYVEV